MSRLKQLTRKNHYIPRFYLKHWATDSRLYEHNLIVSNENIPQYKEVSIHHTAYVTDLYSSAYAKTYDEFEHFIKEYEDRMVQAQEKILRKERLNLDDWHSITEYVLLQYVRTPKMYGIIHSWMSQHGSEAIERFFQKSFHGQLNEKNVDPAWFNNCIAQYQYNADQYTINIDLLNGRSFWHTFIKFYLQWYYHELYSNVWGIVTFRQDDKLITSDSPVVILPNPNPNRKNRTPWGIYSRDYILFPLDPQHLLITEVGSNRKDYSRLSDQCAYINDIIVENAYYQIYFNDLAFLKDKSLMRRDVDEEFIQSQKRMLEHFGERQRSAEEKFQQFKDALYHNGE